MGREEFEPAWLVVVEEGRHALGDEVLRVARPIGAARSVEAHDLVEADAMVQHRRGQVEEVGEFPIPGGQRQVGIEDRDALAGMVERVLQLVAVRLDRRRGLVDQFQRRLARDGARPQEQRQHLARGRGADGGRQQEFRVPDQMGARLLRRVVVQAAFPHEGRQGSARPTRSEIAGDRGLEFAGGGRRAPEPERLGFPAGPGEGARLGALERVRLAGQRKDDEGGDIGRERQNDAANQRARRKGDKRGRAQPGDCERSVPEIRRQRGLGLDRGQEQEIDPGERSRRHAGDGAPGGAAPPEEAAEKGRTDLRDRGEGQKPDRSEPRLTGDALVGESERQNADDRDAADPQHQRADVAVGGSRFRHPPPQEKRHHQIVRDGDREREAVEHHHAGGGGNSADHREQRQPVRAGGERQRQNRKVAVDPAVREHLQPCNRERDHEEVDQNEIEREEPRGRAHAALVVVLNDRDMELPRQENDGEGRQERSDAPDARIRPRLDDRGDPRIRLRRLGQVANAAVEPPHHECADRQKRNELDDQLDGDRKNEAVLVLLRIDAARAEGDGEGRERERGRERDRGRRRARRQPTVVERRHDRKQRRCDRLELKSNVRRGPDERDERGDRRGRLRLAVARRHEIGDRGQVLRARKFGDPSDKRRAEADDEDRANIDRQKIKSVLRREAD